IDDIKIAYDRQGLKEKIKEDIQEERKNIKAILKEEFGLFKKDTTIKEEKKSNQHFEIENPNKKKKKKTDEFEEDDEDF
ncbi:MAG: hypothetical protein AB7O73_10325, partial [Bacteroidia bacterium]